uniref:Uncharacterized protein n=1 Tax=Schistosoma haematobium TaxID=6185 RepID=A0A095CGS9_SCHHA
MESHQSLPKKSGVDLISLDSSDSSSSSSSSSILNDSMYISSTNNHITTSDDIHQSLTIETKADNYSITDVNSSLVIGLSRKRRHPNTFNGSSSNEVHVQKNNEYLHHSFNNMNDITQQENNTTSIMNSFDCHPSKQPKRSSFCSNSFTISSSSNTTTTAAISECDVKIIPNNEQPTPSSTMKQNSSDIIECSSISNKIIKDYQNTKINSTILNNDKIQPRLPQQFLPFNQIDLQLVRKLINSCILYIYLFVVILYVTTVD